jgi:hypothetical protein
MRPRANSGRMSLGYFVVYIENRLQGEAELRFFSPTTAIAIFDSTKLNRSMAALSPLGNTCPIPAGGESFFFGSSFFERDRCRQWCRQVTGVDRARAIYTISIASP